MIPRITLTMQLANIWKIQLEQFNKEVSVEEGVFKIIYRTVKVSEEFQDKTYDLKKNDSRKFILCIKYIFNIYFFLFLCEIVCVCVLI